MGRVLVLVGAGRYADPWHDHAAQGDEVAQVARALGHEVRVRSTRPSTFDDLAQQPGPDGEAWLPDVLVVAASGDPGQQPDEDSPAWQPFHDARHALVERGTAVLALHASACVFADDPRWAATIGGRWVPGRSWHPAQGPTTFRVVDDEHPVTWSLRTVTADDERYADLAVDPGVHVLVVADVTADEAGTHGTAGEHPVVWTVPGAGRVLYDALGHDARSMASPSRRALLASELAWLLHP
ncbi:ThuA domain-containing protein [Cellulomonas sp. CW35]|uniref:ThuA domain-containing protein n=1 Tax=Cellulomonas sp. CW35 TaxID=3458249 RepID=UPI004033E666